MAIQYNPDARPSQSADNSATLSKLILRPKNPLPLQNISPLRQKNPLNDLFPPDIARLFIFDTTAPRGISCASKLGVPDCVGTKIAIRLQQLLFLKTRTSPSVAIPPSLPESPKSSSSLKAFTKIALRSPTLYSSLGMICFILSNRGLPGNYTITSIIAFAAVGALALYNEFRENHSTSKEKPLASRKLRRLTIKELFNELTFSPGIARYMSALLLISNTLMAFANQNFMVATIFGLHAMGTTAAAYHQNKVVGYWDNKIMPRRIIAAGLRLQRLPHVLRVILKDPGISWTTANNLMAVQKISLPMLINNPALWTGFMLSIAASLAATTKVWSSFLPTTKSITKTAVITAYSAATYCFANGVWDFVQQNYSQSGIFTLWGVAAIALGKIVKIKNTAVIASYCTALQCFISGGINLSQHNYFQTGTFAFWGVAAILLGRIIGKNVRKDLSLLPMSKPKHV